jgi:hypothetical protein
MNDVSAWKAGGGSQSSMSSSSSYDYSGADYAHRLGEQLSQLRMARQQTLMEDPLATVGTSGRIRDLQRYLAAFHSGGQLGDHNVLPGVRVSSASNSGSSGGDSSQQAEFFDPQRVHIENIRSQGKKNN